MFYHLNSISKVACATILTLFLLSCAEKTAKELDSIWKSVARSTEVQQEKNALEDLRIYLRESGVNVQVAASMDDEDVYVHQLDTRQDFEVKSVRFFADSELISEYKWSPVSKENVFVLFLE